MFLRKVPLNVRGVQIPGIQFNVIQQTIEHHLDSSAQYLFHLNIQILRRFNAE